MCFTLLACYCRFTNSENSEDVRFSSLQVHFLNQTLAISIFLSWCSYPPRHWGQDYHWSHSFPHMSVWENLSLGSSPCAEINDGNTKQTPADLTGAMVSGAGSGLCDQSETGCVKYQPVNEQNISPSDVFFFHLGCVSRASLRTVHKRHLVDTWLTNRSVPIWRWKVGFFF